LQSCVTTLDHRNWHKRLNINGLGGLLGAAPSEEYKEEYSVFHVSEYVCDGEGRGLRGESFSLCLKPRRFLKPTRFSTKNATQLIAVPHSKD